MTDRVAVFAGASSRTEDATADDFDVVHSRLLRALPELVRTLGGDPDALFRRAGILHGHATAPAGTATYRQMIALTEQAANDLGCPDFGMRLAALQCADGIHRNGVFGPMGAVVRHSRTFGESLEYVSSHVYAHSLGANIWIRPHPAEEVMFVGHDFLIGGAAIGPQLIEQIMLLGHLGAMEITGGAVRARRVHFRHQPVAQLAVYRRAFGCDVAFGRNGDGMFFSDADWRRPIVGRDAGSYAAATAFIERSFAQHRPPMHAQVRGVILKLIGSERCTNTQVAAAIGLHPRTMHRRLIAEGSSFQTVKDEVRRDLARHYLIETRLDVARISEMLGFAEQAVMTRFARRWFGAAPSVVRRTGGVNCRPRSPAGSSDPGRKPRGSGRSPVALR